MSLADRTADYLIRHGPAVRRFLLGGGVLITPLLITSPFVSMDQFTVPKLAFLMVVTGSTVGLRAAEWVMGADPPKFRPLVVPALLVAVPALAGYVAGPYRSWSWLGQWFTLDGLLPSLLLVGFGLLVVDAWRDRLQSLLILTGVAASVVGLYAVLQEVGLDPIDWPFGPHGDESFSTVGNSNFSGAYLAVCLPMVVFLAVRRHAGWWLGAIVMILGIVVSDSQVAMVAAATGMVVGAGMFFHARYRWAPVAAMTLVGLAVTGLIALIAASTRDVSFPGSSNPSIFSRGQFWEAAARMTADAPLLGKGPDAFALAGVNYRTLENALMYRFRVATDPHSELFSHTTSSGIIGGVAFVALILWALRRGVAVLRNVAQPVAHGVVFAGSIAAYFAQSIMNSGQLVVRIALWTALAGLALSAQGDPDGVEDKVVGRPPRPTSKFRLVLAALVATVAAGPATIWAYRLEVADLATYAAVRSFEEGRASDGMRHVRRVRDLSGFYEYRLVLGTQLGRYALSNPESGARFIEEMRREFSYTRSLPHLQSIYNYALLLSGWSRFQPAVAQDAGMLFRRALAIDSINPKIGIVASDHFLRQGRNDLALAILRPYVFRGGIAPTYPEYWGALALAEASNNNLEIAAELADRALAVDPQDERALLAREIIEMGGEVEE